MKPIILLLALLLIISGCEYAGELPEKICLTGSNLTIAQNGSQMYIENGQVEVQIGSCNPLNNQSGGTDGIDG